MSFIVARNNIEYLRFNSVKFNGKSLTLRNQETS